MSQFDLYTNTDKNTSKTYPFFIDVQNNLLSSLNSRVVIPLTPVTKNNQPYPDKLCPVLQIAGKKYALLSQQMTSISTSFLKKKEISMAIYRNEMIAAIDFLITGV